MSTYPPFMNAVGLLPKILNRVAEAQQPTRFTQDFLGTKLGFSGGSAKAVIPLMKRLGMLQADGTPTELYSRFRVPSEQGHAMAEAMRVGYADVFERNEYAHELSRDKFRDLIIGMTGLEKANGTVTAIVGTFQALKDLADFDADESPSKTPEQQVMQASVLNGGSNGTGAAGYGGTSPAYPPQSGNGDDVSMNLSYTINLNLPESTNPDVFNAIFRALREHLLRK